jgi:hypothetical protein
MIVVTTKSMAVARIAIAHAMAEAHETLSLIKDVFSHMAEHIRS